MVHTATTVASVMAAMAAVANAEGVTTTTAASVSGKCANPVFNNGGLLGAPELATLQDEPQPFPAATEENAWPCQAYSSDDTCCDANTLTQIGAAFKLGTKIINETQQLISNNDFVTDFQSSIEDQVDNVCGTVSSLIPGLSQICEDAGDVVDDYSGKFAQALQDIGTAELRCAKALQAYYKGALCFSCEPDWDQYLVRDDNGAVTGFKVHTDTCTDLVTECEGVNDAVHEVADVAVDFVDDLVSAVSSGMFQLNLDSLVEDVPDLCGGTLGDAGDCKTFFCDSDTVSGFAPPMQHNWGITAQAHSGIYRRLTDATANVYTEDGYDAYAVGRADEPDTTWVGIVVGVGAVVVVAAVVAGVVVGVKRARNTSKSMTQALAPDNIIKTEGAEEL